MTRTELIARNQKARTCLKCHKTFESDGPHNRRCRECEKELQRVDRDE